MTAEGAQTLVALLVAGPLVALAATYVFGTALGRAGDGRWGRRESLFVASLLGFWAVAFIAGGARMADAMAGIMSRVSGVLPLAFLVVGVASTYLFGYLFGGEDEVSGRRRAVMLAGALVVFALVGQAFGTEGLGVMLALVFMAAVLVGTRTPSPDRYLEDEDEKDR